MSRALRRRYGRSASTDAIIRRADELGIKHHRSGRRRRKSPNVFYRHVNKALEKVVDFVTGKGAA